MRDSRSLGDKESAGASRREKEAGSESAERVSIGEADALIGRRFNVLDDGFVRLVDYMGGDAAVVQAARVSYGAGTRRVSEDRALIRYLMRHRHTTPFEMCEIKLHLRVPMDCWRQWIRHRTASVNEYSTRYSLAIDAAVRTPPGAWRGQSDRNRQGSGACLPPETGRELTRREKELQDLARAVYRERIDAGVAREQARKDLPLCTYTEAYWKINLQNLFHFLELRMDPAAQFEIRSYAEIIGREIVARWAPLSWEAFLDYRLSGIALSRREIELANLVSREDTENAARLLLDLDWVSRTPRGIRRSREAREMQQKSRRLGLDRALDRAIAEAIAQLEEAPNHE